MGTICWKMEAMLAPTNVTASKYRTCPKNMPVTPRVRNTNQSLHLGNPTHPCVRRASSNIIGMQQTSRTIQNTRGLAELPTLSFLASTGYSPNPDCAVINTNTTVTKFAGDFVGLVFISHGYIVVGI